MISRYEFLNAEFLKRFKDTKEFASFMEELYVRGIEKMQDPELNDRLEEWQFHYTWFRYQLLVLAGPPRQCSF